MSIRNVLRKLLLPLLAAPLAAVADPIYTLTLLPDGFYASAVNNAGQVVGSAGGGAAVWSPTSVAYFLPGAEGLAINNNGDVAGRLGIQGFIYSGGVVETIDASGSRNWATGINDARRVSGTVRQFEGSAETRAFVYVDGGLATIRAFNGYQDFGNAINNAGQVTGFASLPGPGDLSNPARTAYIYDFLGTVRSLGTLGGSVSEGNDINDGGQVAGWSSTGIAGEERPFLFTDGAGMVNLGSLGGSSGHAFGLNNAGAVVGMSDVSSGAGFDYHAFLYDDGAMVDLNALIDPASGWRIVSATDINDQRQILGRACLGDTFECRAVRLDLMPPVPEPGAWTMLIAGLGLLAWRKRRQAARPLLLALLASPLAALADPVYTLRLLPADFQAVNINNAGQVVGTFNNAAAIWSTTATRDLSALAPGSFGTAINSRGHIGLGWEGDGYLYSPDALRNIGRLGIWDFNYVSALNDAGQAAGNAFYGPGERARGFIYSDGIVRIIPTLGGDWSSASAINNQGQVAGIATIDSTDFINPTRTAIVFRDGQLRDLGGLGGLISEAYDINEAGQVVGMAETTPDVKSGEGHAFLFDGGVMADLGFLGNGIRASALGLNNGGIVVGASEWNFDLPFDSHGFLYGGSGMVDINTLIDPALGWTIVSAKDINDADQILALACRDALCTNVLLDPIASAVPEPHAWMMVVAGLALMGSRRRRRPRWSEKFTV
ncbi:PEP-CTERM sorting domain-containing protein [Massilia sp. TWR1-2-2]|uniref:PEP-CTERM sorting domain-containing protein n=1 Tax=Massilia sp. TWR1-2-2 TaxID=2804584 RepID=UPI003CEF3E50